MNAQLEDTEEPLSGELINIAEHALVAFTPFRSELESLKKQYSGVVYDLDDEDEFKKAKKDSRAIGSVKARLDKRHAEIKAPLLEATRRVDGARKEIKDELLAIQDPIRNALVDHAEKEQQRIADITRRIAEIREEGTFAMQFPPSAQVNLVLENTRAIAIDDSFGEWKGSAMLAKVETIEALEKLLAETQKREAEQAELERLRKEKEQREREEREARIAKEAAEKAKREAEEAAERTATKLRLAAVQRENEARQASERAEREIREANARAERAAAEERAKIEREQRAEEERKAIARREEEKLQRDEAHREKIHAEAVTSLHDCTSIISKADAQEIVDMIATGEVAHLRIVY